MEGFITITLRRPFDVDFIIIMQYVKVVSSHAPDGRTLLWLFPSVLAAKIARIDAIYLGPLPDLHRISIQFALG